MTSLDDVDTTHALATRLRDGDPDALRECFERWSRLVHSIANSTLGSAADADDVTQSVFISAWQSRHTLRPDEHTLPGWLVGICRHKVIDTLRARGRRVQQAPATSDPVDPIQAVDATIDRLVLDRALTQLGDPRATVIRLVHLDGLTQETVASDLGMPLGTVKSHLRRGLTALRQALEEVNPTHGR